MACAQFLSDFLIRNGKVEKLRNEVAPRWKAMQDPEQPMAGRGVAVKRVDYAPDLFTTDALKFIRDSPATVLSLLRPEHPARQQRGRQGWHGGA